MKIIRILQSAIIVAIFFCLIVHTAAADNPYAIDFSPLERLGNELSREADKENARNQKIQSDRARQQQQEETNKEYTQICQSWIDQDVNKLIRSWGPPSNVFTMPNGNTMYTYNKGNTTTYTEYCQTSVETSSSGKVLSVNWRGDICR